MQIKTPLFCLRTYIFFFLKGKTCELCRHSWKRSAFLLNKRIETAKQKSHPFLLFSLAEAMAAL